MKRIGPDSQVSRITVQGNQPGRGPSWLLEIVAYFIITVHVGKAVTRWICFLFLLSFSFFFRTVLAFSSFSPPVKSK